MVNKVVGSTADGRSISRISQNFSHSKELTKSSFLKDSTLIGQKYENQDKMKANRENNY